MKELIITLETGETKHILVEAQKTFRVYKEEFIVVSSNENETVISSGKFNNIVLKDDLQSRLGKFSLETLSEDSEKSKINVKVYRFANRSPEVTIEQAIADLTIERIKRAKSSGLNAEDDIDSNLFKKVFGC